MQRDAVVSAHRLLVQAGATGRVAGLRPPSIILQRIQMELAFLNATLVDLNPPALQPVDQLHRPPVADTRRVCGVLLHLSAP